MIKLVTGGGLGGIIMLVLSFKVKTYMGFYIHTLFKKLQSALSEASHTSRVSTLITKRQRNFAVYLRVVPGINFSCVSTMDFIRRILRATSLVEGRKHFLLFGAVSRSCYCGLHNTLFITTTSGKGRDCD